MIKRLPVVIYKEEDIYVALCPILDVITQGKSIEDAVYMIKDAVKLTYEDGDPDIPWWKDKEFYYTETEFEIGE
jgi:predicted RNase H-like HicB family nuclease